MIDYVTQLKDDNNRELQRELDKLIDDKENYRVVSKWVNLLLNKNSGATPKNYVRGIRVFIEYIKKPVKLATNDDILNYLGHLKREGQQGTAKMHYCALLSLYRHIEDSKYPKRFKNVDKPSTVRKETEPLDYDEEIKKLITAWSDNARNRAIVHVLFESMMRKSEFLALRVCDIDLSQQPAPVNVRISKTESGKKRPTFIYNAIPVLKDWLNQHPLRSHADFQNAPLFVTYKGRPLTDGTLRNILETARERAGIKKHVYPHLFRHSRAYELAQFYNFAPQELRKAGGWKNSNMLDVYYNPKAQDIKNKLLNGHGIVTVSQEQKIQALKDRKIRLCACGHENSYDTVFCKNCGIILNIKAYEKEMINKDSELEKLKKQMERISLAFDIMEKEKNN